MYRYQIDQALTLPRKSRDLYTEAFEARGYTGINAATKGVLLSTPADLEKANEYAARVLDIVGLGFSGRLLEDCQGNRGVAAAEE